MVVQAKSFTSSFPVRDIIFWVTLRFSCDITFIGEFFCHVNYVFLKSSLISLIISLKIKTRIGVKAMTAE